MGIFAAIDPVALQRVTEAFGTIVVEEALPRLVPLITDDGITPDTLQLGMLKAHLDGAIAVIMGIEGTTTSDDHLLFWADQYLRASIHDMRGKS